MQALSLSSTASAGVHVRAVPAVPKPFKHARACRVAAAADDAAPLPSVSAEAPSEVHDVEWVEVEEALAPASVATQYTATVAEAAPSAARGPPIMDKVGNGALYGAAAFFGATFMISVVRYFQKYNRSENKSRRKMLSNMNVVKSLAVYLPDDRDSVTIGVLRGLRRDTGFTFTEIFRKFLWYILRDRKFDQAAVDDLLHLKALMQLSSDDVGEALKERSVRIEGKYGNLMLSLEGLSERGVQRKATCRALFSKMLYLTEEENLLPSDNEVFNIQELRNIFGATEEDVNKLRIISLTEIDMDKLAEQFNEKTDEKDNI